MEFELRESEGVKIAHLSGRLVAGTGDRTLRDLVNELLAEGHKKIVVNLAEVTRMDSAGLGELVASSQVAQRFGSRVRFVKPETEALRVLEITRILPALEMHDSEAEALQAFD